MRILVLVPSTGNLYIYMEEAIDDCEEVSSRPLHGESIYLLTMFNTMRAVKQCSRPLHGESIYLLMGKWRSGSALVCSRPLHGESIYLPDAADTIAKQLGVLVPSTGNLYIYFIPYTSPMMNYLTVLVPSTGNLYIYSGLSPLSLLDAMFSSPPRGIYISTEILRSITSLRISSRPLHGESIYLPSPCYPAKILGSLSSLRRKPANQIIFIKIVLLNGQIH